MRRQSSLIIKINKYVVKTSIFLIKMLYLVTNFYNVFTNFYDKTSFNASLQNGKLIFMKTYFSV